MLHLSSVNIIFLLLSVSAYGKEYRTDYTYNRKTNAFYKFHIESRRFNTARTVCNIEGANLLMPSSEIDIEQVHGMFKTYPDIGDYVWTNADEKLHEQANIIHKFDYNKRIRFRRDVGDCEVLSRNNDFQSTSCFQSLPFICKVDAGDAFYDTHCGVHGRNYEYYQNVSSCYKIPRIAYSWDQAYDDCRAEGAHLVILNSELEHDVIRELLHHTHKKNPVPDAKYSWFYFAGLRAQEARNGTVPVYKTVFNQTLEETGYGVWDDNEPNNSGGKEYCGCIYEHTGKYNDVDCTSLYGFVCEKEVNK